MTSERVKGRSFKGARALIAALALPALGTGACNGGSSSSARSDSAAGTAPARCKVRTDCPTYGADASTNVCFLGYCRPDGPGCTTPCSGALRGLTCVHSGVQAHCDGCTHDSACLFGKECEEVTGHVCTPDLDGGRFGFVVDAGPCPDASCRSL